MARYVSIQVDPTVNYGIRDVKPGYGTGAFRFFGVSGSFTVPAGVTEVRVTAVGGGGCGSNILSCQCCSGLGAGGGGGAYVVATVPVNAGCVCNIAVGAINGGASCFGTAVYAYGGCNSSGSNIVNCQNCGGAGGTFCVCSGTCVVGYNGNAGCNSCFCCRTSPGVTNFSIDQNAQCMRGGAAGSPIGGGGTGPFPGTTGTDVYNCRGFNGEDIPETDLATKFGNTIRWPGEAIIGTSRTATTITGTAAGFPLGCSCIVGFGGAAFAQAVLGYANFSPYLNAGYGGGGAGCGACCYCYCVHDYGTCQCWLVCGSGCWCSNRGCPGTGFVVVEY